MKEHIKKLLLKSVVVLLVMLASTLCIKLQTTLYAKAEQTIHMSTSQNVITQLKENGYELLSFHKGLDKETVSSCTISSQNTCGIEINQLNQLVLNQVIDSGEFLEDGFHPYEYEVRLQKTTQDGTEEQTIYFVMDRIEETAISSFEDTMMYYGEPFQLQAQGDFHHISYHSDQEHVQIDEQGNVTLTQFIPEFQVTAKDDGNQRNAGKETTITVKVEFKDVGVVEENAKEENTVEPYALLRSVPEPSDWYSSRYSESFTVTLNNVGDMYTIKNEAGDRYDNYGIFFQVQFLKMETGSERFPANFEDGNWVNSSPFDIEQPYDTGTTSWTQRLRITWPNEEGVFKMRYRLWDSNRNKVIPLYHADTGTSDTTPIEYSYVVGQDMSAPTIDVLAKKETDSDFHVLNNHEILGNKAQLKLRVNADIAGLKRARYQLVEHGQALKSADWKEFNTSETTIAIDDDFQGKIVVEASDNIVTTYGASDADHVYRTTVVERELITTSTDIIITLPEEMNEWKKMDQVQIQVYVPADETQAKAIEYRIDSGEVKRVALSDIVNQTYTILDFPQGDHKLIAYAVKSDGTKIASSQKETRLMIDNTLDLSVTANGSISNQTQPLKINVQVGESGIRELKVSYEVNGTTHTEYIETSEDETAYDFIAKMDGIYTVTLTNGAKESKSATYEVPAGSLHYEYPILEVSGQDKWGNPIANHAEVEEYALIKAIDINPNTSQDALDQLQVCINGLNCRSYVLGSNVIMKESGSVDFIDGVSKLKLKSFEVSIKSSTDHTLGSVSIRNQNQYTSTSWHASSQDIYFDYQGPSTAWMQYKIDNSDWKPNQKQNNSTLIERLNASAGFSKQYVVKARTTDGTNVSEEITAYVNIDAVTPTLSLSSAPNADHSASFIKFTTTVGGSGISSMKVREKGSTSELDITDYMSADGTHRQYPIDTNGTYIFTMTNGVGASVEATIEIADIKGNQITVNKTITKDGVIKAYTGEWTNSDVTFSLHGGLENMDEFLQYEYSTDGNTWTKMDSSVRVEHEEQDTTYYFRVLKKDQTAESKTTAHRVRIDRTSPTDPVIAIEPKNNSKEARLLNKMTFDLFFKEAMKADISSSDTQSPVTIWYQVSDDPQGTYDDEKWQVYKGTLTFDKDANVKIYAKAADEAGNPTAIKNSDGMTIDMSAPLLHGVEEDSGFIPRNVTFEDTMSGLSDDNTVSYEGNSAALTQNYKVQLAGSYEFYVKDKAGNETRKTFVLNIWPNPDDMDGSDDEQDMIDDIIDEFEKEKGKDHLSDDEKQEIQDKIDELINAHEKNRVDTLVDEEHQAELKGEGDTTFPKDARLEVKRITNDLTEAELNDKKTLVNKYQDTKMLQDVYEVKIYLNEEEIEIKGKASLVIHNINVDGDGYEMAYEDSTKVLHAATSVLEQNTLKSSITKTGTYLLMKNDPAKQDPDGNGGNGSDDGNNGNHGDDSGNGNNGDDSSQGGSVDTNSDRNSANGGISGVLGALTGDHTNIVFYGGLGLLSLAFGIGLFLHKRAGYEEE